MFPTNKLYLMTPLVAVGTVLRGKHSVSMRSVHHPTHIFQKIVI